MGRRRTVLAATARHHLSAIALLTVTSTTFALETSYSLFDGDKRTESHFCFQAELLRFGGGGQLAPLSRGTTPSVSEWLNVRLIHIGLELYNVRVGLGFAEVNQTDVSMWLPDIGYTIYRRPVNYLGRLNGAVPEVYVEATARLRNSTVYPPTPIDFTGAMSAVGAVDCFGLGASLAVGVNYRRIPVRNEFNPYLALQLHLPLVRVGF